MQIDQEILTDDEDETVPLGQTSVTIGVKITDRDALSSSFRPFDTYRRRCLVPEACDDDTVALEHFSRVFHRRYGSTGPILYIGSLDEAIQESLYASIDNVSANGKNLSFRSASFLFSATSLSDLPAQRSIGLRERLLLASSFR